MRLAVDAREICGKPTGKGQYLRGILSALLALPEFAKEFSEVDLYVKADQQKDAYLVSLCKEFPSLHVVAVRGRALTWHIRITAMASQRGCNVLFSATSYLPALFSKIPVVTVVHDLAIFFGKTFASDPKARLVERITLRRAIARSRSLLAVSHATAKALDTFAGKKLHAVVTHCAPIVFDGAPAIPLKERSGDIVFVSTLQPRKGIAELLQAYALLEPEMRQSHALVLIGGSGWGGEDYPKMVERLGLSSTVRFMGYLPDKAVRKAYAEASLVVYPSRYEGFGLPLVEAMAAGTPVVTADNSSLPEVVGDAGVVVPTQDFVSLAQATHSVLTNQDQWQKLSAAGLLRAKDFSWQKSAIKVLDVLVKASTTA